MLSTKRVYAPASPEDGTRFLVDRLWPRGLTKADVQAAKWLKALAPSDALRRSFGHDADQWPAFLERYWAELDQQPEAIAEIRQALRLGSVTLLYAARDEERNNAVALKAYLERFPDAE